jgi:PAS domain S-box-containing protein
MINQYSPHAPTPPVVPLHRKLSDACLQSPWIAYVLAILLTLVPSLIHLLIGFAPASIVFIPTIILSAYLGGLRPGLVATFLATLVMAAILLLAEDSSAITSWNQFIHWGGILIAGVLISILSERLHRTYQYAESNQHLRALLAAIVESSDDAIIAKDLQGIVTCWNASAERMFGYTSDEMIGQAITMIIPADRIAEEQMILAYIANGERVDHFETVRQRKDGVLIDVSVTISPIENRDGQIIGASKVVRDISTRKHAEQALRQSEARFAKAFRANPAALVIFRLADGCFLDANETYQQLLGYRYEELIGHNARDLQVFPDSAARAEMLRRLSTQDGVRDYEILVRTKSGDCRTILLSSEAMDFGGEACVIAIGIDITDRKQAEQSLQRSANRLRVLADASRTFAEVGMEYEVLLNSIATMVATELGQGCSIRLLSEDKLWLDLAALYDGDPEKLEQQRIVLMGSPLRVDEPSLATRIFHSQQPRLIAHVDLEQARAMTKPEYWSLVKQFGIHSRIMVPMRAQGQTIGVLGLYRHWPDQPAFDEDDLNLAQDLADRAALAISNARLLHQVQRELAERTRAEQEVRTLSANLEQRVVARTEELSAANRELEAFSYSVSHDLRAPLRAIDGFSRILLDDYVVVLPEEAQHYFQLVRSNAQQMGHLIDDLLAFSRLSRQQLTKQSIDPAALIQRCLEELRIEQIGRQINVRIGELPECQADPILLKQVYVNLISNALKYTRRRDLALIEINALVQGTETIYVVKDNGVGFDMRYSDKLFDVFQRLHSAEDYEGTGVGLAIVQRIIHRHGGRIWAEAMVDHGATFFFTLN